MTFHGIRSSTRADATAICTTESSRHAGPVRRRADWLRDDEGEDLNTDGISATGGDRAARKIPTRSAALLPRGGVLSSARPTSRRRSISISTRATRSPAVLSADDRARTLRPPTPAPRRSRIAPPTTSAARRFRPIARRPRSWMRRWGAWSRLWIDSVSRATPSSCSRAIAATTSATTDCGRSKAFERSTRVPLIIAAPCAKATARCAAARISRPRRRTPRWSRNSPPSSPASAAEVGRRCQAIPATDRSVYRIPIAGRRLQTGSAREFSPPIGSILHTQSCVSGTAEARFGHRGDAFAALPGANDRDHGRIRQRLGQGVLERSGIKWSGFVQLRIMVASNCGISRRPVAVLISVRLPVGLVVVATGVLVGQQNAPP